MPVNSTSLIESGKHSHRTTCRSSVILLLDDKYIEHSEGLKRTFYQPTKIEKPFFHTDQVPWEKLPLIFGSVRFDPIVNRYRMWYICCRTVNHEMNVHDNPALALAESDDCVNWYRADLGLIKYTDNSGKIHNTNMVFESDQNEHYIETGNIIIRPKAAHDKRYMMIYCAWENKNPENRYYRLAYSPDGIHWQRNKKISPPAPCRVDRHCLVYDKANSQYLFYSRGHKDFTYQFPTSDQAERVVTFQTSRNLINWSKPVTTMQCDEKDNIGENIYSLCPFFRGNTLVGVYQLHNQHSRIETVKTYLAWSHDKINWTRCREPEFIELGDNSKWDRYNIATADSPIIVNDEMLFFYCGRSYHHAGYVSPKNNYEPEYFSGICIAKIKIDRFASLSPKDDSGILITKPIKIESNSKLSLNADCESGKIIVQFIMANHTLHSVEIKNQSDTKIPLPIPNRCINKTVRLKFILQKASLYTIYNNST